MIKLAPMSAETFPEFRRQSIENFAHVTALERGWPLEIGRIHAENMIDSIAQNGLETPGFHFCHVVEELGDEHVGYLVFAVTGEDIRRGAFVYDLYIFPQHQRRGYGEGALRALEPIAREEGAHTVGLNVFANNDPARALYDKLGFLTVSLAMRKGLDA